MQGAKQLSSVVKDIDELDIIEFDIPTNIYGQYSLQIDGDDVIYDNKFYFVREIRSKPIVSILNNGDNKAIEEVFNNPTLFDAEILDIQSLDYERLKLSDLIVFNNFYELPTHLIEQFSEKAFLIFPSDSINVQVYSDLKGLTFFPKDQDNLEIDLVSGNSLMRGVFDENVRPGSMPRFDPVFDVSGEFEPIVKFRDNSPFLLSDHQRYIFNTALKESSGFESNALFLPILYQIAFSSAGSLDRTYFYPGNSVELGVQVSDIPIKLIKEKFEVIPAFNSAGSQTILKIPNDIDPGIYYLTQDKDTLRQVAINVPKEESVMVSPSLEELKLAFQAYDNVEVTDSFESAGSVVFGTTDSAGLWKYALFLAMLLILTETMLHRYFR